MSDPVRGTHSNKQPPLRLQVLGLPACARHPNLLYDSTSWHPESILCLAACEAAPKADDKTQKEIALVRCDETAACMFGTYLSARRHLRTPQSSDAGVRCQGGACVKSHAIALGGGHASAQHLSARCQAHGHPPDGDTC